MEATTKESYETLVATLQKEAINFFETPLIAGNMSENEENLTDAQYFLQFMSTTMKMVREK